MSNKKALIVFVKAPVKGRVKTRMQPYLAPDTILRLYKSFVTEIISKCSALKDADKFLGCYPGRDNNFFRELALTYKIRCFDQQGRNLKERIVNAFKEYFRKGYSKIVLIGSDSPSLPVEYVRKAFYELGSNDFVIGPCFDGGLYLIGARNNKIQAVFRNIQLETGGDVNTVLKKMNSENISFTMLPFWYDIDTAEDLSFYRNHLKYLNKKGSN